mgnify:CR=1 FL=1
MVVGTIFILSGIKADDTIPEDTERVSKTLTQPIFYQSNDSAILNGDGSAILHGEGNIKYEQMDLSAAYIRCKMDSSMIYATGRYDTVNEEWVGRPVFKDNQDSYESKEINYNLKTQKGLIRDVTTSQGEGYILADKTKKQEDDVLTMAGCKYTTCDNHEHPHFYLRMTKAKVKPGDYIAAGPAYLVVGEVPVPLAIPFGFFPFTSTYSSGLIMPTFGDSNTRGLYLRGIGYYFAFNDYMDLELTGDIYTRGTWAVYAKSRYLKRYKFSGNISINYRVDVTGEKDLPNYSKANNLSIQWTHQQDSKANPYSNFSASVNFSTSGYNQSNINSYYNPQLNSENTKSSSISYTQRFPDSPWTISLSTMISQRTKDSTMTLTLPDLSISMGSIYPFKSKKKVGKEKWYEKIKLSYSMNGKIAVQNIKEDYLFHSNFLRDWQTGIKHTASMNASWTILKYLSITPSINLADRMYFQRTDQSWDDETQTVLRDTTNGFYNVFDFSVSLSLSTKLYGFYIPYRKWFPNSKVDRFRHVLTPTLSISYHPDFGSSAWGYYGAYDQPVYAGIDPETGMPIPETDANGNPIFVHRTYSRFQGAMYGNASQGQAASLSFGLNNNLEMKLRNDRDTTGKEPYKVWSVIDALNITGGYNFAADSMNWNNFGVSLRLKIPVVNYTLSLSTSLDPYMYELNAFGQPVRTNKQYWNNHRFPHWNGVGTSLSYTFNKDVIKKWFSKNNKKNNATENDPNLDGTNIDDVTMNEDGTINNAQLHDHDKPTSNNVEDGYLKTDIPWSLTLNYSISYKEDRSHFNYEKMYYDMKFIQNISLSGSIGLGAGWKVSASASYDITNKRLSSTNFNITKDLHCWSMSASFVPFGPFKSYTFHIGVNASMLKDLKYDKSNADSANKSVAWW